MSRTERRFTAASSTSSIHAITAFASSTTSCAVWRSASSSPHCATRASSGPSSFACAPDARRVAIEYSTSVRA
ncbi:MAG: hypothetical protein U0326_24620 [Polyangiales bacterium]